MGGEGARVAGSANTADPGTLEGKKPTVSGSRFIHSPINLLFDINTEFGNWIKHSTNQF